MKTVIQDLSDLTPEDLQSIANKEQPMHKAVLPGGFRASKIITTPGGQEIEVSATIGRMNENAGKQEGRPRNAQYEGLLYSMKNRHEITGIAPATILNFLPIPLVLNSPMTALNVRIKPAPVDPQEGEDKFSFHVFHEASIEVMQLGDNISQPWDFMPIQLAKAYADEYKEMGGVVLFRGIPDAETLAKPEIAAMLESAREEMYAWMTKKVEEANQEWNSPAHQGAKNITALHRTCAIALRNAGLIDNLPEWITEAKKMNEVAAKCPICKVTPNQGAIRCLSCQYVLQPAAAFLAGDINEEDASLERLTRAEVDDLGISAYVAETIDERPARLKAGAAKPMSYAQMQALQAQQGDPAAGNAAL